MEMIESDLLGFCNWLIPVITSGACSVFSSCAKSTPEKIIRAINENSFLKVIFLVI
jgi:hypothetical protein